MQSLLSTQEAGTGFSSLVTFVLSLWPETFPAIGIFFFSDPYGKFFSVSL